MVGPVMLFGRKQLAFRSHCKGEGRSKECNMRNREKSNDTRSIDRQTDAKLPQINWNSVDLHGQPPSKRSVSKILSKEVSPAPHSSNGSEKGTPEKKLISRLGRLLEEKTTTWPPKSSTITHDTKLVYLNCYGYSNESWWMGKNQRLKMTQCCQRNNSSLKSSWKIEDRSQL